MLTALRRWLDQRFGFGPIYRGFLDRRVPRTAWYHGDGMALLTLLTVLFVTGPVLALSYCPSLPEANASVRYITEGQFLGWFVRGLHYWAAGLFVAMVGFHLFRQILVGGYKFPREGNWLIGVVMLFLILPLSVIGYTLRWDADGLYGLKVALHMFSRVPVIGDELVVLVQGGTELTSRTLTRLYGVLGPLILLALVTYHLYLIVTVGVTSPVEERQSVHSVEEQQRLYHESAADPQQGETFFPETIGRLSGLAGVMFVLALGLAAFVGPPEAAPAGDLHAATHPAEEWWLSWFSGMVALLPPSVAPWFVVVLIPRSPATPPRDGPAMSRTLAALSPLIAVGCGSPIQSALHTAGPAAGALAQLNWILSAVCAAVFAAVLVLAGVAVFRRAEGRDRPPGGPLRFIVVAGIAVPILILTALLVVTLRTTLAVRAPETPPLTIRVIGHMWWWEVRYPGLGIVDANQITVPVGTPVRVEITSADVIHSFWVPTLNGKTDMIPGRVNTTWMQADRPGWFRGQCAEFCGVQHAHMAFWVRAAGPSEFAEWAGARRRAAAAPPTDRGRRGLAVFLRAGCAGCHAIRGTPAVGQAGPDRRT